MAIQASQPWPQGCEVDLSADHVQEQQVNTLGLDIGGATLKAADEKGRAAARRFPLWRHPEQLADAISELCQFWKPRQIAVVMTGELCDCFETRRQGVAAIVQSVCDAFQTQAVSFYGTDGQFHDADSAVNNPWTIAAANFFALGNYVARNFADRSALLIDIGSTTADFIPLLNGAVDVAGRTDGDRLASDELVYQGVERTPLCALREFVELAGRRYTLMNELFATTLDAYLLLGMLNDDPSETMTADGMPATAAAAHTRIARMIGADRETLSKDGARELASQFAEAQEHVLARALKRLMGRRSDSGKPDFEQIVIAGQGEFLARRIINSIAATASIPASSLAEKLNAETSRCACAYAVAKLAEDSFGR